MNISREIRKYTFEKSVLINTDLSRLFYFHADSNNIKLISPKSISTDLVHISDIPLKQDSIVIVRLRKFIFAIFWHLRILDFNPPYLITDLQERGIFKYWLHYHIFERENGKVKMTDRVEFIPPFGFIGKLFLPVIYKILNSMFDFRHKRTVELFERRR